MKTPPDGTLGSLVRAARKARKLGQVEAAKAAQVSQSHWAEIESGKRLPTLVLLSRIADVLGVQVAQLIPDKIEPFSRKT